MQIIQPHYHAIARTAQDYERMAMSGVVCVVEPAFWAGFDRDYPETFLDDAAFGNDSFGSKKVFKAIAKIRFLSFVWFFLR